MTLALARGIRLGTAIALAGCVADGNADASGTEPSTGSGETEGTTVSSSSPSSSADPSGDPSTASDPTTSPSTTSPSSTSNTSVDTGDTEPDPDEPAVHYVGRYDASDPTHVRMGWSGIGLVVRFQGTGASVRLDDPAGYHTVVIDGVVQPTLLTTPGEQDYVLASGLPDGEHTVELYRRTEGSFGSTVVIDVTLEGELLAPPPVTRRMEIVGDSITAGYGNEGVSPCGFSADTENHYQTYGAIAARTVGAEVNTVAWSGKGVIYNYDTDTNAPMPTLYDRLSAGTGEAWDFSWQPDVVAINLGTNDFSTDGDPSEELFVGAYLDFVTHVREVNPEAFILLLSPSLYGDEVALVDGYLASIVQQRQAAGDTAIASANINVEWIGSGCDGHPTVATHEGMAGRLVEELGVHLAW